MHNIAVEMHKTVVAVASSNKDYKLIDFRRLDVAALLGWHLEATAWLHSWNLAQRDWMDEILLGWTDAFVVVLSCRDLQQQLIDSLTLRLFWNSTIMLERISSPNQVPLK